MSSTLVLIIYFSFSWALSLGLHKNNLITHKNHQHNAHKALFLTLPPLVVGFYFIALRPFDAGGDTQSYLSAFSRLTSPFTATSDANYGTEILYWPTQAVLKIFVNERGWLITNYIIVAFLTYLSYKRATEQGKITPLIFSLVFLIYFAVYAGNLMRQAYVIPLGLIAFMYCYKKEHIKFLIISALAISFHWSAALILASPLFTRAPNKTIYYISIPILSLLFSPLIDPVVGFTVKATGFDWLTTKNDSYLKGGWTSHIEAVWKTANFWICVTIYTLLVSTKILTNKNNEGISKYLLMFISLMLFAINKPDVSERYMACFVFVIPLATAIALTKLRAPRAIKNIIYASCFCIMAILVFTRQSTISTLGIS